MLPNFLGLGGNRCGSTWLAHNLARHEEVFLPRKKELHFFDKEYEKGLDYYESQFSGWAGEPAVGEVTPAYFYSDELAQRIKADLPGVKLFVSLRNPVDRAYSHYWRMIASGALDESMTFEEALQEKELILSNGENQRHLQRYYELFDAEDLLVLFFDDIKRRPESVLTDLFGFLGVDSNLDGNFTSQPVNSSSGYVRLGQTKTMRKFQRALNSVRFSALRNKMTRGSKKSLPPMSEEIRLFLADYYRDGILKTQELTGRDLSSWLPVKT